MRALVAAVMAAGTLLLLEHNGSAEGCAPGYRSVDPVEYVRQFRALTEEQAQAIRDASHGNVCRPLQPRSPLTRKTALGEDLQKVWGVAPEGALREATEQKAAMEQQGLQEQVPGANGGWSEYGRGPLFVNDPRYGVSGSGYVWNSGRVDSMDYDPVNRRLFASVGTGGVWMSTDLGDNWVSIGDSLPTQIIGAVAWTPAAGGTLVAGSGEPLNGGFTFVGMGAYWTSDLGQTWTRAAGVPDGGMTYQVEVDPGHPNIVYLATSKGLFRSTDAGRSFANVRLPTGSCAGVEALGPCQFANWVTDVVVREPGGAPSLFCGLTGCACEASGCPVLAAVGYRQGRRPYLDGTPHAPANGLYRSNTGAPDTFARLSVSGDGLSNVGFAPEERIGRVELGNAVGPAQDHSYVYAIVQDAVLMNGGVPVIDVPEEVVPLSSPVSLTVFNGLYVSPDFGSTWIRMADDIEITYNPATGSALTLVAPLSFYAPGVQSWYNMWIKPDPTRQDPTGVPTRLAFGLEEVWTSRLPHVPLNGVAQQGTNDFVVIGQYDAGDSCFRLINGVPVCPNRTPILQSTTTHPDQHEGLWVPDGNGGVYLFVGHDGGVNRQHAPALDELGNDGWGDGHNNGFYTLLPYGLSVAKDGKVWFGLQDNGSGYIDPVTRVQYETFGADGMYTAVDPDNSNLAYTESQNAGMRRTSNGGVSWTTIKPSQLPAGASFTNLYVMDPLDAKHLMTAYTVVVEQLNAPAATTGNWTTVFSLGTEPESANAQRIMSTLDLQGDAAYVGYCGLCNVYTTRTNVNQQFKRGIATNVGGSKPPKKGTGDGWHHAAAAGLPNRYITSLEIDPADPRTVYAALGGYDNRQWAPPGQYLDPNANLGSGRVFKSTDAAESFVDISGNLPDVPVFWLTQRGNQLLAGTQIGVFISSDLDGTTWAPLGKGLPNVPVMQLAQHPGDFGLVLAATFGRGIQQYCFPGESPVCNAAPVAALGATPESGGAPLQVAFDASASSDADNAIVEYTFDFGDGSDPVTQAAAAIVHTYPTPGRYRATVAVTDALGAVSEAAAAQVIEVIDAAPDAFAFLERFGVATGVWITSEDVTLTGFDAPLALQVVNGQYRLDGGAWTGAAGTAHPGAVLAVRHVSASNGDTATVTTVTVGGFSTEFRSVTSALDRTPEPFGFGTRTGVDPGVLVESDAVTLTGYNTAIPIVPGSGIEYTLDGGTTWSAANGTLGVGQPVAVRHVSSPSPLGYQKTYLKIGGVVGYFTTRTR